MPELEQSDAPALRRARSFSGWSPAILSAAALLGFLIGLGRRAGVPWRFLNSAAYLLLGASADDVWGFASGVTAAGGAVVLAVSAVAGFTAARLASILSVRLATLLSAGIVALAGYLLQVHVAARSGGGLTDSLSVGELRAMYALLAVAILVGTRLDSLRAGSS